MAAQRKPQGLPTFTVANRALVSFQLPQGAEDPFAGIATICSTPPSSVSQLDIFSSKPDIQPLIDEPSNDITVNMSTTGNIPLIFEASEGDAHIQTTTGIPKEVVTCLENARFLQLATCKDNIPHAALMSYTYIPSSQYNIAPAIIMTSTLASRKTINIRANPAVSLLVNDWSAHRPLNHNRRPSGGSPTREPPSSLASLLLNLNNAERSSISATIAGTARIAPPGSDEEKFFYDKHLEENTYDESTQPFRRSEGEGDNARTREAGSSVGGDISVIVVEIKNVRISDYKGDVRDYAVVPEEKIVNGAT